MSNESQTHRPTSSAPTREAENALFTLAHLSDPHLFSVDGIRIRQLINKRILGYFSWRLRRGGEHNSAVLPALLRDLESTRPDHIAVTGDLTHLGRPEEFQEAGKFLQNLGPPSRVTVIPGNHDAYVSTPWQQTFALWRDYMVSDAQRPGFAGAEAAAIFPSLRVRRRVAVIGVCTARPTAPFLAVGRVGKRQLQQLGKILENTGRQGLFRVVLIHHPPMPGVVSRRRGLTDAGALGLVLVRCGVELVLHGHTHRVSQRLLETAAGGAPVIGVSSATSLGTRPGRRARYNLYRLVRGDDKWAVTLTVRRFSRSRGRFVPEREMQVIPLDGRG